MTELIMFTQAQVIMIMTENYYRNYGHPRVAHAKSFAVPGEGSVEVIVFAQAVALCETSP